eukprot:PITA_28934
MVSRATANNGSIKYGKEIRAVFVMTMVLIIIDADTLHSGEFVITEEASLAESSNLMVSVNITVLNNAVAKGAVCLDGSPPAYHLDRGSGSGANSWVVFMEGGGWCSDKASCSERASSALGSSLYMGKSIAFTGILSDVQSKNPDFYGWNRVLVRYCDGSSFTGDVEEVEPGSKLQLRGQRIWQAVIEDLLTQGMDKAEQAVLTGCSAGGLATFIHCNDFRDLLPQSADVKCITDAGFFMDLDDIAGQNLFRIFYNEVVTFHGSLKHLPAACTSKMNPASLCFFPQYLLEFIKTPLFVVNSAYDTTQVANIWVPVSADPNGDWENCKRNISTCAPWQLKTMEGFRNDTICALTPVSDSCNGGLFINSCYAHCQTTLQNLWHTSSSPKLNSKTIAEAVGDWFFNGSVVKYISSEGPHPCGSTTNNFHL